MKTVYKRIFACKLTNNICVIILVRCCGPHWLQPDNIVPVRVRHVIHGGCGVDIKCPHGPSTCIYCRSHSIYDLHYDREAFSYIGCLDNHTWQFFAICCRIFMSSRLFPLVLRTKELLHWSVLPWPRRDTLWVCAYFPIGVLLILWFRSSSGEERVDLGHLERRVGRIGATNSGWRRRSRRDVEGVAWPFKPSYLVILRLHYPFYSSWCRQLDNTSSLLVRGWRGSDRVKFLELYSIAWVVWYVYPSNLENKYLTSYLS